MENLTHLGHNILTWEVDRLHLSTMSMSLNTEDDDDLLPDPWELTLSLLASLMSSDLSRAGPCTAQSLQSNVNVLRFSLSLKAVVFYTDLLTE